MPGWLLAESGVKRKEAEKLLAERGGVDDGHFLVRTTSSGHVLSVIYKGKPTHHKIEPDPAGSGVLFVNGKDYGGLASVEAVVAKFTAGCNGWPVPLVLPPGTPGQDEGSSEKKSRRSKKSKDPAPVDDDPFGGGGDDDLFGGGDDSIFGGGESPSKKKQRPKRNRKEKGVPMGEPIPEEADEGDAQEVKKSPAAKKKTPRKKGPELDEGERNRLEAESEATAARMRDELLKGLGAACSGDARVSLPAATDDDALAHLGQAAGGTLEEDRRKIAEEEKRLEAEAAAAAGELVRQREEARAAAAEKKKLAAAVDSVFEDAAPSKSKGSSKAKASGDKSLSGWRLKKALRKAAAEAEEKEIPVEKYFEENYPELVEHIDQLPPREPPKQARPNAAAAVRSPGAASGAKQPDTEASLRKREEEEAKHKKDEEAQKKAEAEARKQAKKEAKEAKRKEKEKAKKDEEVKRAAEAAAAAAAASSPGATPSSDGDKADASAQGTTAAANTGDKNSDGDEASETKTKSGNDGGGEAHVGVAQGREPPPFSPESEDEPKDPQTDDKAKGSGEAKKRGDTKPKPKSGGWFGGLGIFATKAAEDEEEEDVPDHDLDDDGKPLSRVELLRRQAKRQKQQKRKAALEAKRKKEEAKKAAEAASGTAESPGAVGNRLVVEEDEPAAASEVAPVAQSSNKDAESSDSEGEIAVAPPPKAQVKYGDTSDSSDDDDDGGGGGRRGGKKSQAQRSRGARGGASRAKDGSGTDAAAGSAEAASAGPLVDSGVLKELADAVAELRADRDTLRAEVVGLRRELGQVKAELGRMKIGAASGGGSAPGAASAVYAWHRVGPKDLREYYRKLTERRVELQDRARPGIQDPTQKEMWATEWAALNAELDTVALKLNQSGADRARDGPAVSPVPATGGRRTEALAGDVSYHTLIAFGGRVGTLDAVGYVERFDAQERTWLPLAPLPTVRFGLSSSTLHGYGYLVGGSSASGGSMSCVERYDMASNRWEQVASCSTTRAGLATAVLDDQLYAAGGASDQLFGSVVLSSAERYNPQKDTWRNITPMQKKRAGLALVAFDGNLYALGGYDQNVNVHSSVERYDPQTNSWALIASMNMPRARLAAVVHEGQLYAVGGFDGKTRLASAERFDVATGRWQLIAPMSKPRDYLAAASLGNNLYAVGGYDGGSRLGLVERYSSQTNTWVEDQQMCFPRDGLAVSTFSVLLPPPNDDDGDSRGAESLDADEPAAQPTTAPRSTVL